MKMGLLTKMGIWGGEDYRTGPNNPCYYEDRTVFDFIDGKATAQAIELMREQWQNGETQDLFLIRLMPELLDRVTRVVSDNLRIDKLTILDGGDGNGLPTFVKNLTNSSVALMEQLKNATGVDLAKLGRGSKTDEIAGALPKDLD